MMNPLDGLITSLKSLLANKSRSALTIFGIIIGISSIMLVMSLGEGAQNLILGELQGVGSNLIIVHPGRTPRNAGDIAQSIGDSLTEKDLVELKRKTNVPFATKVEVLNVGGGTALRGDQAFVISIYGASDLLGSLYQIDVDEGRFINEDDVKNMTDVVVIGTKVKEELFADEDPLGEKIRIKDRNFEVVGIIPEKGQASFINLDEAVIMPYTTAQQYIFGIKFFHHFLIEVDSEADVDQTVLDIENTLRYTHDIKDPNDDDFGIMTRASAISQVENITNVLTIFIGLVAAISLIVGGIGIMNIMLVAVTERTHEIGLRKAVGATSSDISSQFLTEAIVLTFLGGVFGVIFGVGFSYLITVILRNFFNLDWQFNLAPMSIVLGLSMSVVVGLIFGIYPAKQAALKTPIEALRYE